jgi:hypothetical protein
MPHSSIHDMLNKMSKEDIILAYQGAIDTALLESVYSMMNSHLEEKQISSERKKKFFYILIESLQNVFHHQVTKFENVTDEDTATAGFIIKCEDENVYSIITGNYLLNSGVVKLRKKLEEVNRFTPEELKDYYRKSLSETEFSEKGGAGLGIIEMARKSGHKLNYEFTKINDEYSFFSLTITIH